MKSLMVFFAGGLLVLSACGYRLEGGGPVHPGVARVGVEMFANQTSYTYAGIDFTNELIREIQNRTDTTVVSPADAAYLIKGKITSITFSTVSRSSTERVTERRVNARVDLELLSPDKKMIWSVNNFSALESFTVGSDNIDDESNIRDALKIIAERMAERLVSQMSANF